MELELKAVSGDGEELRCFFCRESSAAVVIPRGDYIGKGGIEGSREILLKYLVETKNGKHERLLQDIGKMFKERRNKEREQEGGDPPPGVGECDQCRGEAQGIAALHRELETIQMKIVEGVKQFRGKVLQHFGNGSKGKEQGKVGEPLETPTKEDGVTELEEVPQRKLLRILADFQRAVYDKGKDSVDVPRVILNRFAFNGTTTRSVLGDPQYVPVTVKRESVEEDDTRGDGDNFEGFLEQDEPDLFDPPYEDPTNRRASSRINPSTQSRRRKLKKKNVKPDTPCDPPVVECKMEPEEPLPKRSRRIASTMANYLISQKPPFRTLEAKPPERKPRLPRVPGKSKPGKRKFPRRNHRIMLCELCSFSTKKPFIFEHHLRSHEAELSKKTDQPAPHTCDQCSKSFFCKQLHTFHQEGHQGLMKVACDSCNARMPYPDMEAHLRTHTDNILSCVNCSFCCISREKYLAHLKHHRKGHLECDICSKPYKAIADLYEHLFREHQQGNRYVCDVENCHREFFDQDTFRYHQKVHTDSFGCSECEKVFCNKALLAHHQRVHTGEKRYKCPQCGTAFYSHLSILSHQISVHGAPKFKCTYCEKEYRTKRALKAHLASHEGTGIPCPTCGKVFGDRRNWLRHQHFHTTERNHICDVCGKAFITQGCLRKHSNIHGSEKKYKCRFENCGKGFHVKINCENHERTHTGERPYTCELCGKGFKHSATLYNHLKGIHNQVKPERV